MPLIPCICPSCKGQIQFDDSRNSTFCMYCGTQIYKEQVITVVNNEKSADWYFDEIIKIRRREKIDNNFRDSDTVYMLYKEFSVKYPSDPKRLEMSRVDICHDNKYQLMLQSSYSQIRELGELISKIQEKSREKFEELQRQERYEEQQKQKKDQQVKIVAIVTIIGWIILMIWRISTYVRKGYAFEDACIGLVGWNILYYGCMAIFEKVILDKK